MKTLYIHSGLHKTGSTALQLTLLKNRHVLALQDFYYPIIGIPTNTYGHHNIAWELSRDRRFNREYGDISSLVKAILNCKYSKIILSSEDFECILLNTKKLDLLISQFSSFNIDLKFIFYLRDQASYLKSLYFELLKAGFGDEFASYSFWFTRNTYFNYKEWQFLLNYNDIYNSFKSFTNVECIYRGYDSLIEKNTVKDFCEIIDIDYFKLNIPLNVTTINKSLNINLLIKIFVKNRLKNNSPDLLNIVDELGSLQDYSFSIPPHINQKCLEIKATNNFFNNTNQIPTIEKSVKILKIERVFSFETCLLINDMYKTKYQLNVKNQLIQKWKNWVISTK